MILFTDRVASPLGTIVLIYDCEALRALDFSDHEQRMNRLLRIRWPAHSLVASRNPAGLSDRIRAYFDGDLDSLDQVRVETGGTAFQREVWAALRRIPVGTTISYGELAARIGRPAASRAVGRANGANPIPIVVPCHRVIGADGTLTGYGGGLERKRWLLAHEGLKFQAAGAAVHPTASICAGGVQTDKRHGPTEEPYVSANSSRQGRCVSPHARPLTNPGAA